MKAAFWTTILFGAAYNVALLVYVGGKINKHIARIDYRLRADAADIEQHAAR